MGAEKSTTDTGTDEAMDGTVDGNEPYPPDMDDGEQDTGIALRAAAARRAGKLGPGSRGVRKTTVASAAKMSKSRSRLEAQQRRRTALEGRKAGLTYQQIADSVGYANSGSARKAVIKAIGAVYQEPVQELRTLQIERLNHMLVPLWAKVQTGDERAIMTALAVMDKIDRLNGTEAPQEVNHNVAGAVLVAEGSKDDYIAAMRAMTGISPDGTNRAVQVQDPSLHAIAAPGTNHGPVYPPGMGPRTTDAMDVAEAARMSGETPDVGSDIVDGEVVEEESSAERDGQPVDPVPKVWKFGVDPTVVRKGEGHGGAEEPDGST